VPFAPIRVLTADDHPVVREGVRAMIANEEDMALVAEAVDGREAIALYQVHQPDVVLMDLRMPGMDGVDATRAIVTVDPGARIVALTSYEGDADIHRALDAGARGYLLKDMLGTQVIRAIRDVAAGKLVIPPEVAGRLIDSLPKVKLTARELEVLRLAARGLRNREIAGEIGRTEGTVKEHLRHVMEKLGAGDRTKAVTAALQRGIIHLE
jgi:DNA-binding NarL/FixJ family response regulator